jgi:hypothetical protein
LTLEADVQNQIQMELSHGNCRLFRINSGSFWGGKVIAHDGKRLLLENPTKVMGAKAGTSDLLGVVSVFITPQMVGQTFGRFVAIEVKKPGEKPKPHQEQFLAIMRSLGALAGSAQSVAEAVAIIEMDR